MTKRKQLGDWGEKIVIQKLIELGFEIIETNFHSQFGEIDIVAKEKGTMVFIEVKTRSSSSYGIASESISKFKKERLIKTVYTYLQEKNIEDADYRIDLATLDKKNNDEWEFNLINNAFDFS